MGHGQGGVLNNKWRHGAWDWSTTVPPLPGREQASILPARATLDPEIGSETILCFVEATPFIYEIAKLKPLKLHFTAGLAQMDSGPVMFALFWAPSPNHGGEPFFVYEMTLNPHDAEHLAPFHELARQTHWHVVILGLQNEVLDMLEFGNVYLTADKMHRLIQGAAPFPCVNFNAAKSEFQRTYTLEELLSMAHESCEAGVPTGAAPSAEPDVCADAMICDFCGEQPVVQIYECPDLRRLVVSEDGRVVDERTATGNWAACRTCAGLVDAGNLQQLAFHALVVWEAENPNRQTGLRSRQVLAAFQSQFGAFFTHRTGRTLRLQEG